MKKQLLYISLFAISSNLAVAQNKNLVSAINYLGYYNKDKSADDLIEAKKYIDLASENEETKDKAKTWVNRAEIYMGIYNSKDPKVANLKENSIEEAAKAFTETIRLDDKNNYPQAKNGLGNCAILVSNSGGKNYNEKNYVAALSDFEKSIKIYDESLKKIDTVSIYNAAISAERAKDYAKAVQYYTRSIDIKYGGEKEGPILYSMLANVYADQKNTESFFATIQKGRAAYPNDKNLIISELNYYLDAGKYKEAVANLDLAMQKDPNNEVLPYNMGTLYDNMSTPAEGKPAISEKEAAEYMNKAEEAYKKAIELNPNYFDALYNLGALYFNKAAKQNDLANSITDNVKYKIESAKADDLFKKSLPFLEKADNVRTNDIGTYKSLLATLQKLYLMTEQMDKMKETKGRLAAGPNGIVIGDLAKDIETKLGKPVKVSTVKGKFYTTDTWEYPEYTVYIDGDNLTKWVKK